MKRTEIESLGEFGLIDRIRQKFPPQNIQSIRGIGDDAAVFQSETSKLQVISTDMLLEGVHFDLSYYPLKHLGYKSVAVNLSDIAAMNAIPKQITVSLALSNRFSVEAIDEIYEGVAAACKNYQVDLVGGDTTASRSGLVISVTAWGEVEKELITYRNQAEDKQILCVTGDLGAAYLGLQVLEQEKQVFLANPDMQPELEGKDYLVQRQLRPEARMDLVHELRTLAVLPTSMIDVSDGLASDLMHICRESNLGAVIFEENLPLDRQTYDTAIHFNMDPSTCALNGGEDYELLFTIQAEDYEKIKYHDQISFIGYMTPAKDGIRMQTRGGNEVSIQAQGWKHF